MLKAHGLIEADCTWQLGAAAQEQGVRADMPGPRNGVLKQAAPDSLTAQMRCDGHLRELIDTLAHGNQRHAPDWLGAGVSQVDLTSMVEDRAFRVIERLDVLRLQVK